MSTDFLSIDVPKLPDAVYAEGPVLLQEHPSKTQSRGLPKDEVGSN